MGGHVIIVDRECNMSQHGACTCQGMEREKTALFPLPNGLLESMQIAANVGFDANGEVK